MSAATPRALRLDVAHRSVPAQGEVANGDAALIREGDGVTLIALVDVLGHGPEAAHVAKIAIDHLSAAPLGRALDVLGGLHDALRGSRGAAASVCLLRGATLDGCGVGNVDVRVQGTSVPVVLTPGIVGHRMHRLREFGGTLAAGDRVLCFSDGIYSQTPFAELRKLSPAQACALVMERHRRSYDDATVVIADLVADRAEAR